MSGTFRRALTAATLSAGVIASLALTTLSPTIASAASAPDQSLSGTPSSFSTTNNSVTSLASSGGVLYAGGLFTSVTPPGGSSVSRSYLAAFSTTTGQPTSFAPTVNARVTALTIYNGVLYLAGAFTKVNNTTRNHFAAINLSTGTLTSWNPNASGNGYAIAAANGVVYLGGIFSTVGGVAHTDLAAVDATTGALETGFTATADGEVDGMALPSDGSQLVVVGYFNTLSGVANHAVGSVNPTTGAANPWGANNIMPNTQQCLSTGAVVTISGSTAFIGANGQQGGCYDGDFAATLSSNPASSGNGALLWNSPCEGATAALTVMNGVLYKGSHMHDCSYSPGAQYGGFSGSLSRTTFTFYRLIGQNINNGSFVHWSPNTNGANDTTVGPLAMANDGTRLFLAGDFTSVNGSAREGLAVFAPTSITPSAAPKTPSVAPTATAGADDVTITFPADTDTDNGVLTYTIYRGTTQIAQTTAESWPWAQPTIRYTDTGLTPGSSYAYHYKVSDGTTTTSSSPSSATVTVLSSVPAYQTTVTGDSPSVDWRLDDTSGSTAADSSSHNVTGHYNSGDTLNQPGAVGSDAAITVDGSTGYVSSNSQLASSTGFTESAWFKTSSVSGGTIMGDSTTQSPSAGTADDGIWLDDDGQINFDITAPFPTGPPSPTQVPPSPLRSANNYNDGQWHQVVGTYDGTTQNLYVDGVLVGTQAYTASNPFQGYLEAGYDNLNSFMHVFGTNTTTQTAPNSYYFQGGLDEVAAYPSALSAAQVTAQWQGNADLGGGSSPPPAPGQVTGVNGTATSSSVSLNWTAVSGATSYEVDRSSTSASSGFTPLTTTDATNSYTDNSVNPSTNYWYEVIASNGTQGPASAAYAISTPAATPGQVTGVNGTATSSSVSLNWTAVSGATSYEVDRSSTSASSGYAPLTTTDATNSYTDNAVSPSTTYWYEVIASNGSVQGPASSAFQISTPATVTTPGQVTGVSGTSTSSSVSLNWTAVSGATSYEVDRSSTSASSGYTPLTTTDATNSYTDNAVTADTTYWYEVIASNGTQGPASAAYEISTQPTVTTPGQVTGVSGTATSSSVSLNWTAVSGATSYEVDRSSTSATSGYTDVAPAVGTNSYTDNSVSPSTTYWYEVIASNGSTQGAASSAYQIATPAGSSGGTALLSNNFEGGSNGTSLTAANSGGSSGNKFNTVSCSGGTTTYTSTTPGHGSLSGRLAPSTSACYVQWSGSSIPTTTTSYGRMYVNITPGSNTVTLAKLANSAGTRDAQIEITTADKLAIYDANNTKQSTFTTSFPTGWVRIEWSLVNSTTAGSLTVSMYSGDSTTPIESHTVTGINTGAGFGSLLLGSAVATKTALSPFELDDVAYGTTGPLGPGT